MPRVTKADLTVALEESQNLARSLQQDLRVERITSSSMCSAIDTTHARMERLETENEDLKKRVRNGCDRSRSPRMPAAKVEADLATTISALHQVSRWQESAVVSEQKDEIQRLRAEVASLRRGEGPLGEVLAYNDALGVAKFNLQRTPQVAATFAAGFARQTMPVNVAIQNLEKRCRDDSDLLRWGSFV